MKCAKNKKTKKSEKVGGKNTGKICFYFILVDY